LSETRTVRLGDVATIERKTVSPQNLSPETTYLGLEHIKKGGDIIASSTIAESNVLSSKFEFNEEHILYGKLRPYLAKISAPNFSGICSTDILPIKVSNEINKEYLLYYLRKPRMIAEANRNTSGANLPRISPKSLLDLPIELPSLEI